MSDAQVGRTQITKDWDSCSFLGISVTVWSLQNGGFRIAGLLTWYLRAPKTGVPKEKESQT